MMRTLAIDIRQSLKTQLKMRTTLQVVALTASSTWVDRKRVSDAQRILKKSANHRLGTNRVVRNVYCMPRVSTEGLASEFA
jgi:hypothetical protein